MRRIILSLITVLFSVWGPAFAQPMPTVSPVTDDIFEAFKTHPLIGIAEWHGLAQELDFCAATVRDPRFATKVGDLVLETGDAAQQSVVDRYDHGWRFCPAPNIIVAVLYI